MSLSVTVRAGVRELQVLAAFLTYRFESETGSLPDPAVLRKLTLELYLSPRKTPNVSDLGLPVVRLARRWIVNGMLGRDTRGKTAKALDKAERLNLAPYVTRAALPSG